MAEKTIRLFLVLVGTFAILFLAPHTASASCRSGRSSFYGAGEKLQKKTADGSLAKNLGKVRTAASWIYPLGSYVQVSYGGKSILVKITDRGPAKRLNRIIDLSFGAAKALGAGFINRGVSPVTVCANNGRKRMAKDPDMNYESAPGQTPTQFAEADGNGSVG